MSIKLILSFSGNFTTSLQLSKSELNKKKKALMSEKV